MPRHKGRRPKSQPVVTKYGTMWARNPQNIARIPKSSDGGLGVYILFDGSMPMYVGKGKIQKRIRRATKGRRGQLWDHFSWYAIENPQLIHDIEVLMLRILPPTLRSLTRQSGYFVGVRRSIQQGKNDKRPQWISRKVR
jgi:hypothetical protein